MCVTDSLTGAVAFKNITKVYSNGFVSCYTFSINDQYIMVKTLLDCEIYELSKVVLS